MMNISGAAWGRSFGAGGGGVARAADSYDAKIRSLREKRAEYIEKLKNVKEEATSAEHAKQLTAMYQDAIAGIDMQIAQLQKMKAESDRSKTEETGKAESPRKSGDVRDRDSSDPFGEKRPGIRNDGTPEERRRRKEEHLGTRIDLVA